MQNDGARLASIVKDIPIGATKHLAELRAIVARMPRTKDGVPIMAGDSVQRKPHFMERACALRVGSAPVWEFIASREEAP